MGRTASTLQLDNGCIQFDGVKAVDGVSISVTQGEVVGLIGPNGSGKTTTLNLMSGMLKLTSGTVSLDERDVTKLNMRQRVRTGVVRTFQSGRVFDRLSVRENIEAAALGSGLRRVPGRKLTNEIMQELHLFEVADQPAFSLTAGLIRTTAIARAMACRPSFLLLDEPAAGQNETEAEQLIDSIRDFTKQRNIGVLLVEHDMSVIMGSCDRLHVLDSGKTLAKGPAKEVRRDPKVVEVYFGKGA